MAENSLKIVSENESIVKFTPAELKFMAGEQVDKAIDELAKRNANRVSDASTVETDKDSIKELRKARKQLEDARKSVKKTYNEPLALFESEIKSRVGRIDAMVKPLKENVDSFEEQQRQERGQYAMTVALQIAKNYGVSDDDIAERFEVTRKMTNKTSTSKEVMDEVVGQIKAIKAQNDKLDNEVKQVTAFAAGYEINPDLYIQMVKDGVAVGVVTQKIETVAKTNAAKKQAKKSGTTRPAVDPETGEILEKQASPEPVPQAKESKELTAFTAVCTQKQAKAVKGYMETLGLFVMVEKG